MSAAKDKALVKMELLSMVIGTDKQQTNKNDDRYQLLSDSKTVQQALKTLKEVGNEVLYKLMEDYFLNCLRNGIPSGIQREPKPGDLLEIFRTNYSYWAVYVGYDCVVHLAPPHQHVSVGVGSQKSARKDTALVKMERLSVVAGNDKYQVNNKHDDEYQPLPPNKIVQRAFKEVGNEVFYKLIQEYFLTYLRYGIPGSNQQEPKPGDLIEIFRRGYSHWAVYVGYGCVVHLAPPHHECSPEIAEFGCQPHGTHAIRNNFKKEENQMMKIKFTNKVNTHTHMRERKRIIRTFYTRLCPSKAKNFKQMWMITYKNLKCPHLPNKN
ncbi:uncharacterized protein LOC110195292 isoform X2 [Phascolarctos cinereus]|uniref:Uncharacterized protein LOC110195292 isoform X3 n=1 Tax=Phascolarctos cinereus TaxID=38626 RepID=A0A6P5IXD7_PHACI|nr:uncharacterized protein LOC110195292 isoform X3 [Phascolarctos cinereus]